MGSTAKAVAWGALALAGLFAVAVAVGPSHQVVSSDCRAVVSVAAINVDAWREIRAACTEQEQQALTQEFKSRGISVAQIERSRASQ